MKNLIPQILLALSSLLTLPGLTQAHFCLESLNEAQIAQAFAAIPARLNQVDSSPEVVHSTAEDMVSEIVDSIAAHRRLHTTSGRLALRQLSLLDREILAERRARDAKYGTPSSLIAQKRQRIDYQATTLFAADIVNDPAEETGDLTDADAENLHRDPIKKRRPGRGGFSIDSESDGFPSRTRYDGLYDEGTRDIDERPLVLFSGLLPDDDGTLLPFDEHSSHVPVGPRNSGNPEVNGGNLYDEFPIERSGGDDIGLTDDRTLF